MSGHDIAHNPVLLTIFLIVVIVVVPIAATLYGRWLRQRGRRPPWMQ